MKKNSVLLVFAFVFIFIFSGSAYATEIVQSDYISLDDRNAKLVNFLKSNSNNDVETTINNFSRRFPQFADNRIKVQPKSNVNTLKQCVEIDPLTSITFLGDGSYIIEKIMEKDITPDMITSLYSHKSNSTTQSQYKFASNNHYYYGLLNNLLFRTHVECNFGYNGVKAWNAGGLSGYYTRGTLSIWQVSNWTVGSTVVNGGEYCRAYTNGNFHFGVEYQGFGLIIQDVFDDLRVSVTKNGTIYKN